MAGSLIADKIKNVFQKLVFWQANKIYKTAADNETDVEISTINNNLTLGGSVNSTGTLTASSVDVNGGNIDGVVIASSTINNNVTGNITGSAWTGNLAVSGDVTIAGNDLTFTKTDNSVDANINFINDNPGGTDGRTLRIKAVHEHDSVQTSSFATDHNYKDLTTECDGINTVKSVGNKQITGIKIQHLPFENPLYDFGTDTLEDGFASQLNGEIKIDAQGGTNTTGRVLIGSEGHTSNVILLGTTLADGSHRPIKLSVDNLILSKDTNNNLIQSGADGHPEDLTITAEDLAIDSQHFDLTAAGRVTTSGDINGASPAEMARLDGLSINIVTALAAKANVVDNIWTTSFKGRALNTTSTSDYHTLNISSLGNLWSTTISDPTSITASINQSGMLIAPRAGSLDNIRIAGTTADTGANDAFKFYIYKATLSQGGSSHTGTLIGTSSAITSAAGRTLFQSNDFNSSNTFSEGDTLFVFFKKDANSGNQDIFFNITLSGKYTS